MIISSSITLYRSSLVPFFNSRDSIPRIFSEACMNLRPLTSDYATKKSISFDSSMWLRLCNKNVVLINGIVLPPVGILIVGHRWSYNDIFSFAVSRASLQTTILNAFETPQTNVPLTSSSQSSSSNRPSDELHVNASLPGLERSWCERTWLVWIAVLENGNPSINSFELERIRDLNRQLIFCFLKSITS